MYSHDEWAREIEELKSFRPPELTPRLWEIALWAGKYGLQEKEIAQQLLISPRTVNYDIQAIYHRLHISNRSQLAAWVLRHLPSTTPVLEPEEAERQLGSVWGNATNSHLYQFLRWKYSGEPILERCSKLYPVAVYKAEKQQWESPDSALKSLYRGDVPTGHQLHRSDASRLLQQQAGRRLENLPTFTMRRLLKEDRRTLECGLGWYFDALDSCDSLEWEILNQSSHLTSSSTAAFEEFDTQLPLRSSLHKKVANPVCDGSYRSAAIAISILIAYTDDGRTNLMLRLRSAKGVAVHANLVHVIPSFMFQPVTQDIDPEFSVTHNVYREYLEELFSLPDYRKGMWRYFYDDERLLYLRRLIGTNQAKLYFTGIVVNLLNLRPEICTLLWIRSGDWIKHHGNSFSEERGFRICDEFAVIADSKENLGNVVGSVPLSDRDEELMTRGRLQPDRVVPPGAAAFWLGVDVLRQVLGGAAG